MNPKQYRKNSGKAACPAFVEANLKAYSDRELGLFGRKIVERHLSQCLICREEVEALRRITTNMRELDRAKPRPELRAQILANLPNTPPSRTPVRQRRVVLVPRFAMASLLLLVIGVGSVFALKGVPWLKQAAPKADDTIVGDTWLNRTASDPKRVLPSVNGSIARTDKSEPAPVTLPDDPEGINRKAEEIFVQKMHQLNHQEKQTPKKNEAQAYPAVPITPKVQFTPTLKEAQQFNLFEHLRGFVQSIGGNVDHKDKLQRNENAPSGSAVGTQEEKEPTVYVVRIPSSKVADFFKTMGNRGVLQNTTSETPKRVVGQVGKENPNTNLSMSTTKPNEKKPLLLQADADGFVTLYFVIKPVESKLLKPKAP